jgi:hypothetical protein
MANSHPTSIIYTWLEKEGERQVSGVFVDVVFKIPRGSNVMRC